MPQQDLAFAFVFWYFKVWWASLCLHFMDFPKAFNKFLLKIESALTNVRFNGTKISTRGVFLLEVDLSVYADPLQPKGILTAGMNMVVCVGWRGSYYQVKYCTRQSAHHYHILRRIKGDLGLSGRNRLEVKRTFMRSPHGYAYEIAPGLSGRFSCA